MVQGSLGLDCDAARIEGMPIRWLLRQDTLPGREGVERWVAHASAEWSAAHLEVEPEDAAARLQDALKAIAPDADAEVRAHRWRYARVEAPLGVDLLVDGQVLVAGDGCLGGRVEDAWLSGTAAAGHVLRVTRRTVEHC